jgi:hypothetical protein
LNLVIKGIRKIENGAVSFAPQILCSSLFYFLV